MKVESLEEILQVTSNFLSRYETTCIKENNIRLAPLELPLPREIRDIPAACLEYSITRLEHLRSMVCQQYEAACLFPDSRFSGPDDVHLVHLVTKLRNVYTATYHKETDALIKQAIFLVQKRKVELSATSRMKGRCSFKREFTPLLEHYFKLNPYPSTSDRARLAKKCTMSVRQIEVWFQNHRNRARKESRPLLREPDFTLSNDFFESINSPSHSDSVLSDNEDSGYGTQLSGDECGSQRTVSTQDYQDIEVNLLESNAVPSYAFPTRYGESNKPAGPFKLSLPLRLRKSSSSVQDGEPIDVDDLAQLFAKKLHIRNSRPCRKHHDYQPRAGEEYWLLSTVSVASKAPHPALVRPTGLTRSKDIRCATTTSQQILFKNARQLSNIFHS